MSESTTQDWLRQISRLESLVSETGHRPTDQQPTVADYARRLGVRQQTVVDLAEDSQSLDVLTGERAGNGVAAIRRIGNWQLEFVHG